MRGVFDRVRPEHTLREHVLGVAFRLFQERRHPGVPAACRAGHVFRGSIQPVPSPVKTLRRHPRVTARHDSGPSWLATPSTYETCTHTTLPVLPAHWNKIEHRLFFLHKPELARQGADQSRNDRKTHCRDSKPGWS
jgi:hypothetical protein